MNGTEPAFPTPETQWQQVGNGITIRTYIAAKALQGFLALPDYSPARTSSQTWEQATAKDCCKYADALIAELSKSEEPPCP